jgi:predicted transposase YbfD/YdcC
MGITKYTALGQPDPSEGFEGGSVACAPSTAGRPEGLCNLYAHMQHIQDPRRIEQCVHLLYDILVITVLAVICGANTFVMVETFAEDKEDFLRTFLRLGGGIPSHDTIGRVFSKLDPQGLQKCLISWSQALRASIPSEVVAIDGKTLRRSFDKAAKKTALHMVSAFAASNQIVLGQMSSLAKKNEVATIRALLPLLDIKGSIVTIDAAGTQKSIAKLILSCGADFVLALKANHKNLFHQVIERFNRLAHGLRAPFVPILHAIDVQVDKAHGRIEERKVIAMDVTDWITKKSHGAWYGLIKSVVCVESTRILADKSSTEKRFYISSLPFDQVARIANAIRSHWSVENQLHWVLDVSFDQDRSRLRKDHAPENFSIAQALGLNFLKTFNDPKKSIPQKRFKALSNNHYLLNIIGFPMQ